MNSELRVRSRTSSPNSELITPCLPAGRRTSSRNHAMFKEDQLKRIEEDKKKWIDDLSKILCETPERLPRFTTVSDQEIKGLYTPDDIRETDYSRDIGYPGVYPYTRGVQPSMYRGRLWTMRMFSGLGGPEETNNRFHYLMNQDRKSTRL